MPHDKKKQSTGSFPGKRDRHQQVDHKTAVDKKKRDNPKKKWDERGSGVNKNRRP